MVYCGKPSKGCSHCRERKIRCDQREPGCGQCEKRQQKCPGYRNLVDLMFRDESSHVIKKAKARARKKANLATSRPATPSDSEGRLSVTPEPRRRTLSLIVPPTPTASSPACRDAEDDDDSVLMSPRNWPRMPPMTQIYDLAPSCQERGVAYFFSRYLAEEMVSHQKFDFLRDVWKPSSCASESQVDGVLASMTAVGLMGMASTARSPDLMGAARLSYGTALRLINHALEDPAEAVKDSTMLSVLILGVFEMMTENTSRTLTVEAFKNHLNGAMELARMRGPAQFQTRAGRRMFSMLCQRVIISSYARGTAPMPEFLIELWHEMCKTSNAGHPDKHLMPLLWQVQQLRYEIKIGILSDPHTIVDRLLALDHELQNLTAQLAPSWKYRTFKLSQPHPAVFGSLCHLYSSLHHATVWTHIRTTRILVLETLLATPHYLDAEQQHKEARRTLRHLVRDVAAAVPQLLGLMNPADGTIVDDAGDAAPIATVEIRQTPSPPTSPSSRSAASSASEASSAYDLSNGNLRRRGSRARRAGPTILDPTRARAGDADDEAERYMLLVSATSPVVWPLFVVGMSSACSTSSGTTAVAAAASAATTGVVVEEPGEPDLRTYVIGRLRTLYMETGIRQADGVANLLEEEGEEEDEEELGEAPDTVYTPGYHHLEQYQDNTLGLVQNQLGHGLDTGTERGGEAGWVRLGIPQPQLQQLRTMAWN